MPSTRLPLAASADRPSAVGRLLFACALANVGAVVAYLPLLGLILPMRVENIAGNARIGALTAIAVAGLVTASIANIVFGWLSDRTVARGGSRRGGMVVGLVLLVLAYASLAFAGDIVALAVAIMAVQIAVNAVLAPLFALIAEVVPDTHKGTLGGLIAWGQPTASAMAALLIAVPFIGDTARFALIPATAILLLLPVLRIHRANPGAAIREETCRAPDQTRSAPPPHGLVIATIARFLVQTAGSVVGLYLLYYLETLGSGEHLSVTATRAGSLMTFATLVSLPLALAAGRWSDRTGRRRPVLVASATIGSLGLIVMAAAKEWLAAAAGYTLFTAAAAVFLSINAGLALQMLPHPQHRGRDLGLFNLANTIPAFAGPLLTWWLMTPRDFSALMLLLAALVGTGALVSLALPERRRPSRPSSS